MLLHPNLTRHLTRALRQLTRAPTHKDLRPTLRKQLRNLLALLPHALVHVLVRAGGPVPRKGRPHAHHAVALPLRQLVLVDEVFVDVAAAKVQDGGAQRARTSGGERGALLDEAAHGRKTGAGCDHDDWRLGVGWKVEADVGWADEAADAASCGATGEVGGCDALEVAVAGPGWG